MEYAPMQMPMPMQFAAAPPPPKSHKAVLVVLLLVVLAIGGASAAYFVSKNSSTSTCPGVTLWSGPGVGIGSSYCAKPGTGPSDLPFVPQAFYIPAGANVRFSVSGTTAANNNTGTISIALAGTAGGPNSIAPTSTIIKVTAFSVTAT